MVLNVIIFGAPGSGKGTQSVYIAEKYGLEHLSTGDLLRAEQQTQSELGKLISSFTDQGNLVPDELIISMLAKVLDTKKNENGYIFDGFPRTTAQAEALKVMLAERGIQVSIMIDLEVCEEELIERLLKRGVTSGRSDDNYETIQKRIQVYHTKTAPVLDFYKKEGLATEIKGSGSMQEIFNRISAAISMVK
jgi:adenylate kinase